MRVYKIVSSAQWSAAQAAGSLEPDGVDLADGYVHLSTAEQAPETLRLHFHGRDDLVILQLESADLGEALRWEPSRGGALFPHLYAPLEAAKVLKAEVVPLDGEGAPTPAAPLPA